MAKEKGKEEYEIIPLSPLRRLEKRISQLESSPAGIDTRDFFKEMVSIIRMNQQLVDELAKANDALRIELSRLPSKLEDMTKSLDELISFIKAAATEEAAKPVKETLTPLTEKMDKLIEMNRKIVESNQSVVTVLDEIERKLRRPRLRVRKQTLFPPKPKV